VIGFYGCMNSDRRLAVAALTTAGLLWGTTVPLSKVALDWLPSGWLTFVRFGLAAAVLLVVASRSAVRTACTPAVLGSGAVGYGGSVVVQNAGITRTSVTHAALLIGAAPVLVAIIAALWHRTVARPVAWAGFAVSLAGVGLVTGGGGGGATAAGDGLVLVSLLLSATFTVAQTRLLRGRDPVAVTAVQFLGAALAVLPFSVAVEGMPAAPGGPATVLAAVALVAGGTLLPFTLFAYAQSRVSAEVAGAFLNLEPLVGAAAGAVVFGDPAGPQQIIGGAAILAGIALSSLPLLGGGSRPAPARERQRQGDGRGRRQGVGGRDDTGRWQDDGRRQEGTCPRRPGTTGPEPRPRGARRLGPIRPPLPPRSGTAPRRWRPPPAAGRPAARETDPARRRRTGRTRAAARSRSRGSSRAGPGSGLPARPGPIAG
jgi:O-acetylserine/cysteine efflux transporter